MRFSSRTKTLGTGALVAVLLLVILAAMSASTRARSSATTTHELSRTADRLADAMRDGKVPMMPPPRIRVQSVSMGDSTVVTVSDSLNKSHCAFTVRPKTSRSRVRCG